MRSWIVLLLVFAFTPLQAGLGCALSDHHSEADSSCHSSHSEAHQTQTQHGDHHSSEKLRESKPHSSCFFCDSGICNGLRFLVDSLTSVEESSTQFQCKFFLQDSIPLDFLFFPIMEPSPPDPGFSKKSQFLSFHSWQSLYSVYII